MKKLFVLIAFLAALMPASATTISNLALTAQSGGSATIQWTTDVPSSTQLWYGVGQQFNQTPVNPALVTSHTVTLTGVGNATTYSYYAVSVDVGNNKATSPVQQFTVCTAGTGLTNVQGTVNNYYEYGDYVFNWVPPAAYSGIAPTVCGQPLTTTVTGNLDHGSSLSLQIPDTNQIVPSPSQWGLSVSGINGVIGLFTITQAITPQGNNLTQALQLAAAGNLIHVWYDPATDTFYPPIGGGGANFPPGTGIPQVVGGAAWGTTLGVIGTDTNVPTASTFTGGAGTGLCVDSNGGIGTSGCQFVSGTTGFIPVFTGANTIGNSIIDQGVTVGGQITVGQGFDLGLSAGGTATPSSDAGSQHFVMNSSAFSTGILLTVTGQGSGYVGGQVYTATISGETCSVLPTAVAIGTNTGTLNVNIQNPGSNCTVPGTITTSGTPGSGWSGTLSVFSGARSERGIIASTYLGAGASTVSYLMGLFVPGSAATSGPPMVGMLQESEQGLARGYVFSINACSNCTETLSESKVLTSQTASLVNASGDIALYADGLPVNQDCVKWLVSSGVATLGDAGAACGSGGGSTNTYPLVNIQTQYSSSANLGGKLTACLTDPTVLANYTCDATAAVQADSASSTAATWTTNGTTLTVNEQNNVPIGDQVHVVFGTTTALTADYTITARTATSWTAASSASSSSGTEAVSMFPLKNIPIEIGRSQAQIVKWASGGVLYDETPATTMATPGAPTVVPTTGTGSLPAATYLVTVNYRSGDGVSLPSTEVSQVLSATGELTITGPATCPTYAQGYDVNITSGSTGTELLQGNAACGTSLVYGRAALFPSTSAQPTAATGVPAFILYNVNHPSFYADSGTNGSLIIRTGPGFGASNIIETGTKGYSTISNITAYNFQHVNMTGASCFDSAFFTGSIRYNYNCVGTGGTSGNPSVGYKIYGTANDVNWYASSSAVQDTFGFPLIIERTPSTYNDIEGMGRLSFYGYTIVDTTSTEPLITIEGLGFGGTTNVNGAALSGVNFVGGSFETAGASSCATITDAADVNFIGANCQSTAFTGGTQAYLIASTAGSAAQYTTNTVNVIGSATGGFPTVYQNNINGLSITVPNNNFPYSGDYHYGGGQHPIDIWQSRPVTSDSTLSLSAPNALTLSAMSGTTCLEQIAGVVTSTVSGCGSGTVNSATAGQISWYATTGTAISGNANATLDSSGDASFGGQLTVGGTGTAHGAVITEGTAITPVSGTDILEAIVANHRFQMSLNGASPLIIPGIATAGTANNCVKLASNGIDITDAGSVCGSGGSGTVNSGTAGQVSWYATTGTAVSGNANATLDTSGDASFGGTVTVGGTGTVHGLGVTEGTAYTPVTGQDILAGDSGTHRFKWSFNGGTAGWPIGVAAAGTTGDIYTVATDTYDAVDSGVLLTSITRTIASGTAAMPTTAISSGTCSSVVTVSASGVATTDTITASPNGDPTATTGYLPLTTGSVYIWSYPTSGNVNFKTCNNSSGSITPGAVTLNWRVVR